MVIRISWETFLAGLLRDEERLKESQFHQQSIA